MACQIDSKLTSLLMCFKLWYKEIVRYVQIIPFADNKHALSNKFLVFFGPLTSIAQCFVQWGSASGFCSCFRALSMKTLRKRSSSREFYFGWFPKRKADQHPPRQSTALVRRFALTSSILQRRLSLPTVCVFGQLFSRSTTSGVHKH